MLEEGKHVMLEIDIQGAMQVKKRYPQASSSISYRPAGTSWKNASAAVRPIRTTSSPAGWPSRQEFREIPKYDYLVINDKVANAVHEIEAILTAAECRVSSRSRMLAQFA